MKRWLCTGRDPRKMIGVLLIVSVLVAGTMGCAPTRYTLIITSTEGGTVTAPGEGQFSYSAGSVVQLVAEAEEGHRFVNWAGDVDSIADVSAAFATITVDSDSSVTAEFVELDPDELFGGGSGTPADPYHIANWHHLNGIRHFPGVYYTLVNDLDADTAGYNELAGPLANDGKGWQPIGTAIVDQFKPEEPYVPVAPFTGNITGQGYEIRDLLIYRPDEAAVGLFGTIGEGGVVDGVRITNAAVTGLQFVGGLAGGNDGVVTSSYASGSMDGEGGIGSLVGRNQWGGVYDCHSTGSVTGEVGVGGLVGVNDHGGTISLSHSAGNVAGWGSVGGLVGLNSGAVSYSHSTAGVSGSEAVGGLAGANLGNLSDSYADGSVTGGFGVGGLVGASFEGSVYSSYSGGTVTGGGYVGGLVGWSWGVVAGSHSAGSVSGQVGVGGLIGLNGGMLDGSLVSGSGGNTGGLSSPARTAAGDPVFEGFAPLSDDWGAVRSSYSTATVTGIEGVGGLVGINTGTVSSCYSSGGVLGSSIVGGLVGLNEGLKTAVTKSYAAGSVAGEEFVGGLVGWSQYALTETNSFWDTEATGMVESDGGTGKTTAEMMDIATFTDTETEGLDEPWDMVAVADADQRNPAYTWNIVDGETYPFLSWEAVA